MKDLGQTKQESGYWLVDASGVTVVRLRGHRSFVQWFVEARVVPHKCLKSASILHHMVEYKRYMMHYANEAQM